MACISSPLRRARQTAEAIWPDGPIELDDRWQEMGYGELEGKPVAEVRALVRDQWRVSVDWAPAGGEALSAVSQRVIAACADLVSRYPEGDVIAVTHVSPIKVAVAWALGVGAEIAGRLNVELASVTLIDASAGRQPALRAYNVITALRAPGTGGRAG